MRTRGTGDLHVFSHGSHASRSPPICVSFPKSTRLRFFFVFATTRNTFSHFRFRHARRHARQSSAIQHRCETKLRKITEANRGLPPADATLGRVKCKSVAKEYSVNIDGEIETIPRRATEPPTVGLYGDFKPIINWLGRIVRVYY